jgi:hypothetical protein
MKHTRTYATRTPVVGKARSNSVNQTQNVAQPTISKFRNRPGFALVSSQTYELAKRFGRPKAKTR